MVKHIGGVSSELLNIPGKRTGKEDTMIARYLIRRISAMKNKKNAMKSRHIVYERRSDEGRHGKAVKGLLDRYFG